MNGLYIAISESVRDVLGIQYRVANKTTHLKAALAWMVKAQKINQDGGVAAWYSCINGWRPSYIETTGYIIETFLSASKYFDNSDYYNKAIQMGDFLIQQQLPSGGYRSHTKKQKVDSHPTIFDTGQDILGMCDLYEETGQKKYLESAVKAADFLCQNQEKQGYWIKHTFGHRPHVYHTRVAWPLLRVALLTKSKSRKEAALNFFDWALQQQTNSGWFNHCELVEKNQQQPYTHTLAYAVEGFLYAGLLLKDKRLVQAAVRGSLAPMRVFLTTNFLPATFNRQWKSNDRYMCLTGNAQYAVVWGELYKLTGYKPFKVGLQRMLLLLSATQARGIDGNIDGAIKGSLPIYGDLLNNTGYCRLAYLNWATKYYIDALLCDLQLEG